MAIDGTDPEVVRDVLEVEVEAMKERHKGNAAMMTQVGVFAPTFGIIGAVIGLIATMGKLDDPEHMAHGISAAFVATFWGVFMANGLFLPFGNKLKRASAEEAQYKQLIVEGILAIQAGSNPRVVGEMLKSFLPPKVRATLNTEEKKSA
jgi:chemotaxis protein MotA